MCVKMHYKTSPWTGCNRTGICESLQRKSNWNDHKVDQTHALIIYAYIIPVLYVFL